MRSKFPEMDGLGGLPTVVVPQEIVLRTRPRYHVLETPIDAINWEQALTRVRDWADQKQSRYVCTCNVHSVVTARLDPEVARSLKDADLTTADGAPIAWMLRHFGVQGQQRISGPDLMWRYCAEAARRGESIYLYGSKPQTLELLQQKLLQQFPGLRIAGAESPPFRELTQEEDEAIVQRINASGASTVWVSLGCPKQEQWMAAHRGRVQAVMLGVGAAFDFHAGTLRRAPLWMQRSGLEWLHRLASEPRRLGRRYVVTNTLFILGALRQIATRQAGR